MSKAEINNEIVLMRHSVRQARICVVSKLTREVKRLREKRGDEKQREKNARKAERLLKEISVLKAIRDDTIAKFGITNYENPVDMLQQPDIEDTTRIMRKIVRHKRLCEKIKVFREKFSDYEKYLSKPKKYRGLAIKNQTPKKCTQLTSNCGGGAKSDETSCETKEKCVKMHSNCNTVLESKEHCDNDNDNKDSGCDDACLKTVVELSQGATLQRHNVTEFKVTKQEEKLSVSSQGSKQKSLPKPIRIISEQATVKRLADILQEPQENQEDINCLERSRMSKRVSSAIIKEDDFFVNPDDCTSVSNNLDNVKTPWKRFEPNNAMRNLTNRGKIDRYTSKASSRRTFERWKSGNPNENVRKRQKGDEDDSREKPMAQRAGAADAGNDSKLHPSWMARRKERDIMKIGFRGTKIIFADD